MSIYESQALEIYEHFYRVIKDREKAKASSLFLATQLMRFAEDRLYWSKVVLSIHDLNIQ
jgi:hypothetical protein